jgi:DNA-binding CsgD family transcriptional regulator
MRAQRGLSFSERAPNQSSSSAEPALTLQEREIVRLVSEGYDTKDIARCLLTSERAVENGLNRIYKKVGVSDRLGLALYAVYLMQMNWKTVE